MIGTTYRLALRNTLRRRARSLLTTGMVVLGVALLLVALTWIRGASGGLLASAAALGGHVRVVDPDYAVREELLPLYEKLPTIAPLVAQLQQQPGVVAVEPASSPASPSRPDPRSARCSRRRWAAASDTFASGWRRRTSSSPASGSAGRPTR